MKRNLSLGNKYINNLASPINALQAVNKTYCDSAIATAGGAFLPLSGGTMSGGIIMSGNYINGLPTSINPSDATNKNYVDTNDTLRLLKAGDTMTGNLNMNSNNITNVSSVSSASNTNFVMNYLNGATNLPKISLTSGRTLITDGLLMNNVGIDMSGNTLINLPTGVNAGDATNKGQLDLKLNLSGSNSMTGSLNMNSNSITNAPSIGAGTSISLKIATITIMQIQALKVLMSMPIDMSGNAITNLPNGVNALDGVNRQQLDSKLNLSGGTLSNTLTFSGGGIDMSGNNITKVSNINSNGTNAIFINNNNTAKVKIDSLGLTMQNSGNLDMNNGTISNTTLTMPKITAPIQTTTSSVYSFINNSYLNIGYTVSNSYNIYTTMTQTTYYALLGANNRINVDAGVWIITGSFKPFCISGTPDTQAIQMIVSNVNNATEWTAYPSSKVRQILNGNYDSNDEAYIVNTFVITLSAQTYLYLWGYVQYSGSVSWAYDFAELRATRIA